MCTGPLLFYCNSFVTLEWDTPFYQMLNEVMRRTDRSIDLQVAETFFTLLNNCLLTVKKVPKTTTLYRGIYVKGEDWSAFKWAHDPEREEKIVWNTYTSTSLKPRVAKAFAKRNVPGQTSK